VGQIGPLSVEATWSLVVALMWTSDFGAIEFVSTPLEF
jgi:hypothetical protein